MYDREKVEDILVNIIGYYLLLEKCYTTLFPYEVVDWSPTLTGVVVYFRNKETGEIHERRCNQNF